MYNIGAFFSFDDSIIISSILLILTCALFHTNTGLLQFVSLSQLCPIFVFFPYLFLEAPLGSSSTADYIIVILLLIWLLNIVSFEPVNSLVSLTHYAVYLCCHICLKVWVTFSVYVCAHMYKANIQLMTLILIKPAKTWCNVNEITLVCIFVSPSVSTWQLCTFLTMLRLMVWWIFWCKFRGTHAFPDLMNNLLLFSLPLVSNDQGIVFLS